MISKINSKIAIMIPARSGSKRVKKKNLRLLSGKPLIAYVMETALKTKFPVYVNSDCEVILSLAEEYGCIPYKRDKSLCQDSSTNDNFAYDFMNSVDCDYVLQVLPTSPFVTVEELNQFSKDMVNYDTLVSVKDAQIGCVYKGKPINFKKDLKNPPSQEMEPVKVYATALMGWKVSNFKRNMLKLGCAYHGGEGNIGYFTLKGWSTVDIDNEEDFMIAESIAQMIPFEKMYQPFYYEPETYFDSFVPRVLKEDGVLSGDPSMSNREVISVTRLMKEGDDTSSWYHTLVDTENNSCTLINQLPGEGNRKHYHAKWNEWWYILRGQWRFEVEDKIHNVKAGDLVFIRKGRKHKITAIGDKIASRIAVSRYDVEHIYNRSLS